jgi:uncharacterized membrane protein YhhN
MRRLFLLLSAALAVAYGFYGYNMYGGAAPYAFPAAFKASSVVLLGVIALAQRSNLLAAGLLFGALGDALLAWSHEAFLYGALAFLVGHLCYIALFVRAGAGDRATTREPIRIAAMLAIAAAALLMTTALIPRDSALYAPLGVYTGVLTIMAMSSFTLPWTRWLAIAGAVLFFISDGFVAWNMFHHDPNPTSAFWRSFAGWMIYWAGQAGICIGALGLRNRAAAP